MLELDLLLLPFFESHFDTLSEPQQKAFEDLLAQTDPELFSWLMGHQLCPDARLASMVQIIREAQCALS